MVTVFTLALLTFTAGLEDLAFTPPFGALPALTEAGFALTVFFTGALALLVLMLADLLALGFPLATAFALTLPLAAFGADLDLAEATDLLAGLAFTRAFLTGFLVAATLDGLAFPVIAFLDFLLFRVAITSPLKISGLRRLNPSPPVYQVAGF
ncbi:MAG TPA: hypothetical protein VJ508_19890 [Saprospiraceae bacterium]|nr:hypothetical protein [Saprospiraceae bacterium]